LCPIGLQSIGKDNWPKCGGANGSIRFDPEILHAANSGLKNAILILEPVKAKFPDVGYADLFQLASATAVEVCAGELHDMHIMVSLVKVVFSIRVFYSGSQNGHLGWSAAQVMGGPKIPMRYGRKDATGPDMCHPEGNLPAGAAPWPTGGSAEGHLRAVFHRMGLTDKDIVALSGAHSVGRAHAHRSGLCHKPETKYTAPGVCPVGTKTTGGASWTPEWIKFDNSYFTCVKEHSDEDLLVLDTDAVLFTDEKFKYALCCPFLPASRNYQPFHLEAALSLCLHVGQSFAEHCCLAFIKPMCIGATVTRICMIDVLGTLLKCYQLLKLALESLCTGHFQRKKKVLTAAPTCRPYAEEYAADEKAFFDAYAESHAKLSEIGVEWEGEPVSI
jgi:hypothetical protein